MLRKPPADLMPRGRPTKYRPEFCQQIITLMAEGLSITAAAAEL
jgi:hypothetical protein